MYDTYFIAHPYNPLTDHNTFQRPVHPTWVRNLRICMGKVRSVVSPGTMVFSTIRELTASIQVKDP